MRAMVVAVLCLFASCSSGSRTTTPVVENPPPPPPPPPPPNADTCPPAFNQAGGDCDPAAHPSQCNYAEGSCYCGIQMPCSGAMRSDEELAAMPSSWQCTAKPPVVRPDGCPGEMPSEGRACSPSGRKCSYGSCCFHELSCVKGEWKMTGGGCPP
jgi:hypothetical protein